MKRWLCILLALGFSFTNVYAADDDDWEGWEEEEAAPAKKTAKKAAKKASSGDSQSRIGLFTSFGASSSLIGLAYDMGTGIQFGAGVSLDRQSRTAPDQDPVVNQTFSIEPLMTYELGEGLLNYGVGLRAFYRSSTEGDNDPVTSMGAVPNFYISTALVPNVALSLNAGLRIEMLGEIEGKLESGMNMETVTSLMLVFYFL